MRKIISVIILSFVLFGLAANFLSKAAYAELLPALSAIPAGLPDDIQKKLSAWKAELEKALKDFQDNAKLFNDKSAEEQTDAEFDALQEARSRYVFSAKAFNAEVVRAAKALMVSKKKSSPAPIRLLDPETARIIKGLNALARKLGWSVKERDRLDNVLNHLDFDEERTLDGARIRLIWRDILSRGQDADLLREASQGEGLGFPHSAGKQTVHQDCTIFALASAAGLPYGVVAARATRLIREGEWRSVGERADPQELIERKGLIGGEVVMLAEAFGQAEIVPVSDFAKTLKEGRPLLVNVVPPNMWDIRFGHEVVLTKTFQHGSETWYVMMDSNQGPQQPLFVSAKELDIMLKENGIGFRPDPGTTPKLLREEEHP